LPLDDILLGVIGRPHGVRGLSHVHAYSADAASLTRYGALHDGQGNLFRLRWRGEGVAELSRVVDGKRVAIASRDEAQRLVNTRLYVARARLPKPAEDEFYLSDLIGLAAVGPDGVALGTVSAVHDYGAGASLEVGLLLVPFTRAAVPEIDLVAGRVTVVPPAEVAVP